MRTRFLLPHSFYQYATNPRCSSLLVGCIALVALLVAPTQTAHAYESVPCWQVAEIALQSGNRYTSPFRDVDVDVKFTDDQGSTLTRPAFWDGDTTWRVRFAPTHPGVWRYLTKCSDTGNRGLNGVSGKLVCTPYNGKLDIYRHGFVRVARDHRHLSYSDGTPFFWLADTHWLWEKERFNASNRNGWPSQFKGMVDRRVEQGFTVYQVELFGRWRSSPPGGSAENGNQEIDVTHFQNDIDPKWKYLAERGVVVATTLGILPKDVTVEQGAAEARMARYVCARYGAYPSAWLMFQECTANIRGQFPNEESRRIYMDVVKSVGSAYQAADCYHQPRTAHSDSPLVTAYRGESWLDLTLFQGGHFKSIETASYLDFYNDPVRTMPQIEGEANYEHLFEGSTENQSSLVTTDSMREKAYHAIQCGCCGYTYGANGVWQATWGDEQTGNQTVYGNTSWKTGIDLPGGQQLKYLKDFYTALPWTTLIPRPECDGYLQFAPALKLNVRPLMQSDAAANTVVVYYSRCQPVAVTIRHLQQAPYAVRWLNPRSGEYSVVTASLTPDNGTWTCPHQPDGNDWILVMAVEKPTPEPDIASESHWNEVKAARLKESARNVALNAHITASSTDLANKVYSPESAVDGNSATNNWNHWSNDGVTDPASPGKPVWLVIDWPNLVTINKIILFTMQGYEVRDYAFEYDDGTGWKPVPGGDVRDNVESMREHPLKLPLTLRRLRFLGKLGPEIQPTIVRVVEIEAIR